MTDRFNPDDFESESTEIAQDIENTLDRVVNDYANHWQGVIGEWIQNSYDGWCHNRFGRRNIPEDQPLHITLSADLSARTFTATDNAGGMPEDVFYHNFVGLDTPGEEKQSGEFGGSYGRGSHVISGLGETMYGETHHNGFRGGVVVKRARQLRVDADINPPEQGTIVEISDCDVETLVTLTERDRVEEYIRARFNPLLQHDNVTVEYEIDGVSNIVEPFDTSQYDVLWEGDLTFEYGGQDYTLHDLRIFDATSGPGNVPIGGIAMLKSNAHMDRPFMRVQDYKPRQLRHLDKVFGYCDASELCPKFEDNAHNSFTGNIVNATGLKKLLEEIEREHFIGTPTDLDAKDEIVNATLDVVNNQWGHNPFGDDDTADASRDPKPDDETDSTDDTDPTGTKQVKTETKPDDDSDPETITDPDTTADTTGDDVDDLDLDWADTDETDEEETEPDTDPDDTNDDDDGDEPERTDPELTCSTRQRSFEVGDDVTVWAFIENPEKYPNEQFTISAQFEHEDTGELIDVDEQDLTVPPGSGSTGEHSWELTPDNTGKYLFRATLFDSTHDERERLDSTNTWFWVGRDTGVEDEHTQTVAFLEDVVLVRSDDEDFRAELTDGDRGMVLVANTRHPEYKHAVGLDGRTGSKNQKLTLIRWAHDSIMTRLLIDQIDDDLADMYSADGESLAESLGGFVRENLIEQQATLMAGAHNEV